MQVIRYKMLSLTGIRTLYSASALGMDGFIYSRNRIKSQFHEVEGKFKEKMSDFIKPDSPNMIFTEDLKHMIHLAEDNDNDLNLTKDMMLKFSQQNKDMRFGSFIFGPVVMRMYYNLDKPNEALEVFKILEKDGFFDQLISYQILMDLLLKHNMYNEVIDVFNIIKQKQLRGTKYPKNAVVLVLAACYKLNTPESYEYAKQLWADLNQVGHYPMRRAGTFAAALAIQQNEPHVALEILTSMKQQSYVTVRNLKLSALADLGRPDDALPLMRNAIDSDRPGERKNTFCEEIINKIAAVVEKFNSDEITQEFGRIEKELRSSGKIVKTPLEELLCSEIVSVQQVERPNYMDKKQSRRINFSSRPGLQDMV